jgi:hypothetical protein
MNGLYLYGIRQANAISSTQSKRIRGIDGRHTVKTIQYDDLEAIVSTVDFTKFNPKVIGKKAKEDLKWIATHAGRHDAVLKNAMHQGREAATLLPMKFGMIFKTQKNLERALHKQKKAFLKKLHALRGKQEWGIKVYLDQGRLANALKKTDETLQALAKKAGKLPDGMAFFVEKEIEEVLQKRIGQKILHIQKAITKVIKPTRASVHEGKCLTADMTVNMACLLPKEKIPEWQKAIKGIKKKFPAFSFVISGPWPPYNFV